jgi:hypothetical protein
LGGGSGWVRVRVRLGRGIGANNLWSRSVVGQRQAPPAAHPPGNALFTLGTIGPAPLTAPRCPADLVTASQSGPQTSRVRPRPKQSGPPRRFVDCQRIAALASPPDPTLPLALPPLPGDLSPSGVRATACNHKHKPAGSPPLSHIALAPCHARRLPLTWILPCMTTTTTR